MHGHGLLVFNDRVARNAVVVDGGGDELMADAVRLPVFGPLPDSAYTPLLFTRPRNPWWCCISVRSENYNIIPTSRAAYFHFSLATNSVDVITCARIIYLPCGTTCTIHPFLFPACTQSVRVNENFGRKCFYNITNCFFASLSWFIIFRLSHLSKRVYNIG